jgi:L-fucose isomerase, C-terminal domain
MKGYFPLGGGPCSGISKPGVMTWACFYEMFGEIGMDGGIGEVMDLPQHEVNDRLKKTPSEWPLANVHIPGDDRDQLMATHRSNHITIGDGNILPELVATCLLLGIPTRVAGDIEDPFK